MKTMPLAILAALSLFTVATAARADATKQLGAGATTEEIIQGLTPTGGTLTYRGLRVLGTNRPPANEPPAPAVALDIRFALNSAALSDEAKAVVARIAAAMKSDALDHFHFRLEGHTDTSGTADHNLVLSRQRAQAVRDDLVQAYGIQPTRLEAVGRGAEDLIDPAAPESADNRRVKIVNLGQ
jgi:OmpA-OmpF porin, OOP family